MRINPDHSTQQLPESHRTSAQNSSATGGKSSVSDLLGQDRAQLSGNQAQVQSLAAQVAQLPEVRTERVSALRQAGENGSYHPHPEEVASAVFSYLLEEQAA